MTDDRASLRRVPAAGCGVRLAVLGCDGDSVRGPRMIARPALVIALASLTACGDTTPPAPDDAVAQAADPPVRALLRDEKPPDTTTTLPPTTTSTSAPPATVAAAVVERVGPCAGWEPLIAVHFPAEEVGTACRVMMCETAGTGSPTIHNPSSSASGMWQFLSSTWESVTSTPAPAANYSADVQTAAAASLWRTSGWGPWSCA